MEKQNIFPVFERMLDRSHKEKLLRQKSKVIWVYGLSGSGKTTIAIALEKALHDRGFLTQILDGDNVRSGINNNLGFTKEDRAENLRRIAEVNKLFYNCGLITINCFISPLKENREHIREIIGKDDFIEIFVDTPIEECERRDEKGLYKKARAGELKNFTGVDAPFEKPETPDIRVETIGFTPEKIVGDILDIVLPKLYY
ncbi:MAG: adenylyl-sulfate kinase [Salinivirgaceae bacterium]|nr:adenylyl-sulfate kinase [Salinivirgaceae bacterium]